ncbi:hypothetical protein [Niveibacterium sp. SC-1]|uniref:hypothetical protein n=1 Tax=Niveibacterium sp. SC-1 TaxID=3135646 RepID=UPI00311FA79D
MQYETLYDLAAVGYRDWQGWALAAALFLLAAAFLWRARRRGTHSPTARVIAFFGLVTFAVGGCLTLWDYQRLTQALRDGTTLVAEGPVKGHWTREVEHYDPDAIHPYSYRTWESFSVAGVTFGYWQDHSRAGFQNSEETPLAIQDGMQVRIRFVEDVDGEPEERRILRLERPVARS